MWLEKATYVNFSLWKFTTGCLGEPSCFFFYYSHKLGINGTVFRSSKHYESFIFYISQGNANRDPYSTSAKPRPYRKFNIKTIVMVSPAKLKISHLDLLKTVCLLKPLCNLKLCQISLLNARKYYYKKIISQIEKCLPDDEGSTVSKNSFNNCW